MNNVNNWMNVNKLTLNFSKSNILLINPIGLALEKFIHPMIQTGAHLLN